MTDFPDLKIKALVSFPAAVFGGAGVNVRKENGQFFFDLAFDDFAPPVTSLTDRANENVVTWNKISGVYSLVPVTVAVPDIDPSDLAPLMDGVAAPGVSVLYTRADHVHPSDTSRQPLDAELTAIAGLVSAADRLPYFTGVGTASLAIFTAYARTLLDDIDATAARATLGLTSAATTAPAALTKTDDINVTATLGGTPGTALLQATSITLGWTGTLSAARGGFGQNIGAAAGVPVFAAGVATFDAQLFSNIPQNSQSVAYTLVAADAQKHIFHPAADNNARTYTIPANASVPYPIGTCITFVNKINTLTIAINADTLTLSPAGTTGSRTLAANGVATAMKIAATEWIISGPGLG